MLTIGKHEMDWLQDVIFGGVFATFLATWLLGFLNRFVPSPGRSWLAGANFVRQRRWPRGARFRFVLCWLENDKDGNDTAAVAQAFRSVSGVALARSARIVTAAGAADHWRPAVERSARALLEQWDADLAIVGTVKKPGEVLSLWLVPQASDGTLRRGDVPYKLEDVTLGQDFHDDLRAELTAVALAAAAPLALTETRGRVLGTGLIEAADKLSSLLEGGTIDTPERRGSLYEALGNALLTLGERDGGTERLDEALQAHLAALENRPRERVAGLWARTQNNIGTTLLALGERESGSERLEQSVEAYRAALEERTRDRVPLDWAMTTSNLGAALQTLGERESGTERLEQAEQAYRATLEVRMRERMPLDWAMIQNNLGAVLFVMGERESGSERLERSVEAYRAALEERTRDRVPLDWAMTTGNLGAALQTLGERESGTERLELAEQACRAALEVHTRERMPLDWAMCGATIKLRLPRQSG